MDDLPLSLLVARSILVLLKARPRVMKQIADLEVTGDLVRYPDGSLFAEGTARAEELNDVLCRYPSYGAIAQRHFFRALGPFPEMVYRLDFPRAYDESLMPEPFVAGNAVAFPPKPSEFQLERLALTAGFRRRPRRAIMERFAAMVHEWYTSVREHGVLGEGPITGLSTDVELQGLGAPVHG